MVTAQITGNPPDPNAKAIAELQAAVEFNGQAISAVSTSIIDQAAEITNLGTAITLIYNALAGQGATLPLTSPTGQQIAALVATLSGIPPIPTG